MIKGLEAGYQEDELIANFKNTMKENLLQHFTKDETQKTLVEVCFYMDLRYIPFKFRVENALYVIK